MSSPQHKYVASRPLPPETLRRMGPRRPAYHKPVYRRSTLGVFFRRMVFLALLLVGLGIVGTLAYKVWIDLQTESLIYEVSSSELPTNQVAMVFGAGLNRAGGPSAMLYDRVATAADLYNSNKVDKLLMTGDNGMVNYNEVEVMRQTAIQLGVPDQDIVLDYAGFNTWDSCYRAREVFSLSELTIVSQRFHLPRALYTCKQLGVDGIGVAADRQPYPTFTNELREYVAIAGTAVRFLINDRPRFLGPKINVGEPPPQ